MPIYEYRCEKCGDFEEMQRITDPPIARCPKCKGKVRRLISSTSFQLKGSGWYATDYGRSGGGNGSAKDEAGKKDATPSAGSESKPASESTSSTESKPAKPASSGTSDKSSA